MAFHPSSHTLPAPYPAAAFTRPHPAGMAAPLVSGDQLARAAHELKAPAAAMLGLAELLATDTATPPSPQQAAQLRNLLSAGRLLVSLVDELLDLSQLRAGRVAFRTEALDLNLLAGEALAGCTAQARAQGLQLSLHCAAARAPVLADRRRVMQVLMNLLSNATKYNRRGGSIELSVGPGSCITVADRGDGLDATQMAQLFEPFNRLGREHGDIEGSGIGLALSRELVQGMDGTLMVASTPGVGTTVTVSLPPLPPEDEVEMAGWQAREAGAVPAKAASARPTAPRPQLRPARAGVVGEGCLLCIDDNPVSAMLLQEYFSSRRGPQVRAAANARDGLALAHAERPLAVLLDLSLPDMHGLELLHQLRSDPATHDIPVAIVSGTVNSEDLRRARGLGAQACWPKPLDLKRVDALLADLLQTATVG